MKQVFYASFLALAAEKILAQEASTSDDTTSVDASSAAAGNSTESAEDSQETLLGGPMVRRFNSIASMAYTMVGDNTAHSRNDFEDRIKKYGCYCFTGTKKEGDRHAAGGAGEPVDGIDDLCRKLTRCHKCLQITFPDDDIDVDNSRYTWEYDESTHALDCSKNKNNPSRKALCECDASFATAVGAMWTDSQHQLKYWHSPKNKKFKEQFDFEATCTRQGTGGSGSNGADQCCGTGIEMKPYNSGEKQCCDNNGSNKIYDATMMTCCQDGSVKLNGACVP